MVSGWVDRRMDRWTEEKKDGPMAQWMEITSCVLYGRSSKGIHASVKTVIFAVLFKPDDSIRKQFECHRMMDQERKENMRS